MSRGINKVILIGNLGADPEVRYAASGGAITNIRLATSESWKDKQTGDQQERTEWHRVVFFGKLGEIAGEYLRKGSKVYIEGSIRTEKWQGQDGQDRYTTKIIANEMQMLDSRGGSGAYQESRAPAQPQQSNEWSRPPQTSNPATAPQQSASPPPPVNDFDDDIPF